MSQEQLFASFILDRRAGIEIALPAEQVIEAMPLNAPIQPLPTGAVFLEGVMPLRGDVIPVINLKKRLALAETEYGADAKVAVIQFNRKRYGLLVDDIRDVLRVAPELIEHLDAFLLTEETVIADLIKLEQGRRTLELLDLQRLFPDGAAAIESVVDRNEQPPAAARTYSQFVVYSCRRQVYGIPVADSREICFFADIDQTFKSGKVEGALQLRGQTIPVLCSATLLGCTEETLQPTEDTRILVMQSDNLSFGLIVDKVHQILVVADDEILTIPGNHLPHLQGVCNNKQYNNIMLLDVQGLISSQTDKINAMSRLRKTGGDSASEIEPAARHLITEHCYLVFAIGKHYAIELKDVQEIIDCGDFMQIASGGGLVQGIINLRGRIVPVLSLRNFYNCPDHNVTTKELGREDKLIIGKANGNLVALLVDEIVTIYKQERFHATPSLRPELQSKKDTLDRLIEFVNDNGLKEHVLVVNVANVLRNHLQIPDQETTAPEAAAAEDHVLVDHRNSSGHTQS
ncbi:chemotaxis protein CheW [Desulfobulbus sp.]|uniref:chemotaxis protein CheW n=1 Tax=Desulfobulbus sp. TaxID=895 RepID=UPI0027BAE7D2|nr:chemotaxis protein CheW [Desulfobulbus sp.]